MEIWRQVIGSIPTESAFYAAPKPQGFDLTGLRGEAHAAQQFGEAGVGPQAIPPRVEL